MSQAEVSSFSSVLKPCPSSPNCVCSLDPDQAHRIDPYIYPQNTDVWPKLKEVIARMPRTKLVSESEDYLHYEFRTRLFRFKDDVEIWHDPSKRTLHFRSASRMGHSDLGTNRRRIEGLKSQLAKF